MPDPVSCFAITSDDGSLCRARANFTIRVANRFNLAASSFALNDMRHRGYANALYFDGHVAPKKFKDYLLKDFDGINN